MFKKISDQWPNPATGKNGSQSPPLSRRRAGNEIRDSTRILPASGSGQNLEPVYKMYHVNCHHFTKCLNQLDTLSLCSPPSFYPVVRTSVRCALDLQNDYFSVGLMMTPSSRRLLRVVICASKSASLLVLFCPLAFTTACATVDQLPRFCEHALFCHKVLISISGWPLATTLPLAFAAVDRTKSLHLLWASVTTTCCPRQ